MEQAPDGTLLQLARDGEEAAFATFATRWLDPLFDYCTRLTGSTIDGAQLTGATLWRAMNMLGASTTSVSVRAWLFAIARDLALDRLDGPNRLAGEPARAFALDPAALPEQIAPAAAAAQAAFVAHAVARTPPSQLSLLALAVRHGFSPREVAAVAGIHQRNGEVLVTRLRETADERIRWELLAEACDGMAAILAGHVAARSRLARREIEVHIARCRACATNAATLVPPLAIYAALAPLTPSTQARAQVLGRLRGQWPGPVAGPPAPATASGAPLPAPPAGPEKRFPWVALPLSIAAFVLAVAIAAPASPLALTRDRRTIAPPLAVADSDPTAGITVYTSTPRPDDTPSATVSAPGTGGTPSLSPSVTVAASATATPRPSATATRTPTPIPTATAPPPPPPATPTPEPPIATPTPTVAGSPTPCTSPPSLSTNVDAVGVAPGGKNTVNLYNSSGCASASVTVTSSQGWLTILSATGFVLPPFSGATIEFEANPPPGAGRHEAELSFWAPNLAEPLKVRVVSDRTE